MPDTTQFGGMEQEGGFDGALKPNTILLARYKVIAVIGGGGQGAVYQARDLNFPDAKRLVAIKEMHVTTQDPVAKASSMKTFQRESNILATLSHPAIPKIYDFFDQNDRAYLVEEFINGSDLENLIVKAKKLPMEKIIEWSIDLCDVLHYLHSYEENPIIFRDMKPANVMIDSLGKVRLIDFGIAKIFVSNVKHTQIGTEGYSAPEQYKGNANPSSDIYSLGATLHHVLTREDPRLQPPFSFAERPILQYNPEVSPQFAQIVDKALSFEPENRWKNCLEMKQALEALRYRPLTINPNVMPAVGTPAYGVNTPTGTGFIDGADNMGAAGIQPKWTFKTEDEIRSSPSAMGGLAYVGSYDTNIWAVNLETGEFVWKRATTGGIAASPTVDKDLKQVYIGSEDGNFYCLDGKTGRIAWQYASGDKIRSTARFSGGNLFFGSDDNHVHAILATNGRHLWGLDTGSPIRSTPCVTQDRVIVGNEAGDIYGIELNGVKKWSIPLRKTITSSPVVDIEGVVYLGCWDGFLYAVTATDGYKNWRFRTNKPIISSPTVEGNIVYFTSTDGKLYAVNTQTSKQKWDFDTTKPIVSSPVYHDGMIYFGGTDGIFYAIDAKSGKESWRYETQGPITSSAYIADNLILIGSTDHILYAFPLVK
jgi:serine/threonine protein kinase